MTEEHPVVEEVRALARLDLEGLRQEWRRRYGAAPKLRSPDLLRRILAYRMQAAVFGDLTADTKRKLRAVRATKQTSRDAERIRPGVRIAREWKGVVHEVEVVEGGFLYAGTKYRSLSKIASTIAGGKWNGPRFFGLRSGDAA